MDVDVAIVGGGLAGLFTGVELRVRGIEDVVVLERGSHPGGVARSLDIGGYSLEPAAGTLLLPHPHLSPLLERIGAEVAPAAPAAATRYVYTRSRLVAVRPSPGIVFSPMIGWGAKVRAAAEPLIRRRPSAPDESLDAFMRRRLGDGLGGLAAWLAASGVFAGDPERLSARAAFPAITALEDEAGSIVRGGLRRLRRRDRSMPRPSSHVPVPDMASVASAAAGALDGRVRAGVEVTSVHPEGGGWFLDGPEPIRARRVILACRPLAAAGLIGGDLATALREAVSAPAAVVWLGGSTDEMPLPEGFGALVGRDAGLHTLGVLFESSYAPHRAPDGSALAKIILGGTTHPELAHWDEERIVAVAISDAERVLGTPVRPDFTHVVRHPVGIPQYEVGHRAWLERLGAMTPDGIHLTGWGYRGVGVAHVAGDAARTAAEIAGR